MKRRIAVYLLSKAIIPKKQKISKLSTLAKSFLGFSLVFTKME